MDLRDVLSFSEQPKAASAAALQSTGFKRCLNYDLLPFYAILRSIPNKLLGVIAMFGSLLILLILPLTDLSRIRGAKFRPIMKMAFWFFVVDFAILTWIGSQHPTSPYVEIGQIATAFYFAWFLVIVPFVGVFENS